MVLLALALLTVGTYAAKAAGLLVATDRELPLGLRRAVDLLPAALLAALVVTQTVADGQALHLDARIAGVAAAGLAVWLRAPFAVVVVAGMATTAGLRALGVG
ncbi:AzlD domain-containing protein [Egicoccus sp. AB-alg2]|uniref:AzlD domain-containing protein n=1 Tax=Egicoccus sp. AB-alg2 TaxID=3242693 RepID=UPI00359EECF1